MSIWDRFRKAKQVTVVRVDWVDSASMDAWHNPGTVYTPLECITYGVLIAWTSDAITVAHSAAEQNNVCGVMIIPQSCVRRVRKLGRICEEMLCPS